MSTEKFQLEKEHLNGTKPSHEYYVHLLVGITETRHCLATLREYVLSVWEDSDQSRSWQTSQRLLEKLAEQFGLQMRTIQVDTQLISNCLQSLKHKVNVWDKEMQLYNRSRLEKVDSEDKRNVNCSNNNNTIFSHINTSLIKMSKGLPYHSVNNDNTTLLQLRTDHSDRLNENKENEHLQKQVKDLISQLESQYDQINSLWRANQNYKEDYRNKVKSLNRSMAMKMAAMNRAVVEVMEDGGPKKKACHSYETLLQRIASLNSQLSEKKREVQTLKTVVNYNRSNSDYRLKKLQDQLDEYKENDELTKSVRPVNQSYCEDSSKELIDFQSEMATLKQENTNLRHLLSLEVTQKLQLLTE